MGGDEFVLMAPYTDAAGAERLAERIREELARAAVDLPSPCTVSVGISTSGSTPRQDLLREADRALYEAKRTRRAAAYDPPAPQPGPHPGVVGQTATALAGLPSA